VHHVSDWQVPLRDGTTTLQITGTLDWVPPPDPGTWWATVLLLAAAIAALGLVAPAASSPTARGVRTVLAGAACTVGLVTAGYPLLVAADNAEPGAGSLALALLSQVLPVLVGLALIAAGGFVLARREVGDFGLATAGVCAALFLGAANGAVFLHGVTPITADGWWARLAIATILSGGIGLAGAGVLRMRRSTRSTDGKPKHETA
jgi:hypothetical protein